MTQQVQAILTRLLVLCCFALYSGASMAVSPQVSAGGNSTCALAVSGAVFCWGGNAGGQLGNGTNIHSALALQVSLPEKAVHVAGGDHYACAVLVSRRLWCWGVRSTSEAYRDQWVPRQVANWTDVVAASVGLTHACALRADKTVWCWGNSQTGALGRMGVGMAPADAPVQVERLEGAIAISTRGFGGCALTADGQTQCWGGDTSCLQTIDPHGLCTGTTAGVVPGLAVQTVSLGAGGLLACGVDAHGAVLCWRYRDHHGPTPRLTMFDADSARVQGLANIEMVDVGFDFRCVLTRGHVVLCWGANGDGQAQPNAAERNVDVPTEVALPAPALSVHAGLRHACAMLVTGHVACWGRNSNGELGAGSTTPTPMALVKSQATGGEVGSALSLFDGPVSGEARANAHRLADVAGRLFAEALPPDGAITVEAQGVWLRSYPQASAFLGVTLGSDVPRVLYLGPASFGKVLDLGSLDDLSRGGF